MWTLRGQKLLIFVISLSMVLVQGDADNGPFGTLPEYAEGGCVSPEPEGVDKVNEKLTNILETEGFSVAACSRTYAAIIHVMYNGNTVLLPNETSKFAGKYEANRQDLELFLSYKDEPIKMRCERVTVAKKKCYKLPQNEFTTTLTIIWTNEKLKLVVGCTSDGYKFWAVFSARVADKNDHVEIDDEERKTIFSQVEKLGFKRDQVYYEPA